MLSCTVISTCREPETLVKMRIFLIPLYNINAPNEGDYAKTLQ